MLLVHFLAEDKLKIPVYLLIFQGKGIIWKFSHFPWCSNVQTKYGTDCGIIPCEHFNTHNNISIFIQIQIFFPDINVAVFLTEVPRIILRKQNHSIHHTDSVSQTKRWHTEPYPWYWHQLNCTSTVFSLWCCCSWGQWFLLSKSGDTIGH